MVESGTSNEELLQLAIRTAKRKQRDNARMLFLQVYQRDPNNEIAMMWLAKIAPTRQKRIQWLEQVIEVNPNNEAALKGLEKLKYKQSADENRTLLLFGGVAVLMIVLVLAIVLIVLA